MVLVRPDGERCFVTNRRGSLRRLSLADILPALESPAFEQARLVSLASLFVSPALSMDDTAALFRRVKARGKLLCADTTRPKGGETLREAAGMLEQLDWFFPNAAEAALLTGRCDSEAIADALLDAGVAQVALKLGGQGCLIKGRGWRARVPAWPDAKCVDTTGAGDTFAAAFMAGLLEGMDPEACARYANAAASLCVERVGATAGGWTAADARRRAAAL